MNDTFQNKYRIPSARASWHDYGATGYYFVTICTAGKECNLGSIVAGEMCLSEIGNIVDDEWTKSFAIRTELFCESYVIMPNHIHTILRIEKVSVETHGCASFGNERLIDDTENVLHETHNASNETHDGFINETHDGFINETHDGFINETHGRASLRRNGVAVRTPKSISSFVAGFKSVATKRINELRGTPKLPVWQTRFHDHIIRNDDELKYIANYIEHNVMNWGKDTFFESCNLQALE